MLYRIAGKTGQKVSSLGFGAMRLPVLHHQSHRIDEAQAQAMVDYAVAHGINYFDTAYIYHSEVPFQAGTSELFLGRALKPYRSKVHLATKLPSWYIKSREDMDRYLDEQLQRLQTDHIDFYLVHSLNTELWPNLLRLGVTEFLDAAIADGRIGYAGFSFHDELPLFKQIVDAYDWSFCQLQYNFMDEECQAGREGMRYAAARGLGVVIMEPLRGGSLAERIPPGVQAVWDKAASRRTPAEWALRFVWHQPEPCVVLSGMSNLDQMAENVSVAAEAQPGSLSAAELSLIEEVKALYLALTSVNCTSCGYCLPCPTGVNIPANFLQLNNLAMFGNRDAGKFFYQHILKEQERAAACTECAQCEDLCPQHLSIRERLKEVAAVFA
jgi:uncharacterized protein